MTQIPEISNFPPLIETNLLGLSGWFGAELVFRHKVAVVGYGDPNR